MEAGAKSLPYFLPVKTSSQAEQENYSFTERQQIRLKWIFSRESYWVHFRVG